MKDLYLLYIFNYSYSLLLKSVELLTMVHPYKGCEDSLVVAIAKYAIEIVVLAL
jgi:hypothetical protein